MHIRMVSIKTYPFSEEKHCKNSKEASLTLAGSFSTTALFPFDYFVSDYPRLVRFALALPIR